MKSKPKVIRQRRRKDTNAEAKAKRKRKEEYRRQLFNDLRKSMLEAGTVAKSEPEVKETATTVTEE